MTDLPSYSHMTDSELRFALSERKRIYYLERTTERQSRARADYHGRVIDAIESELTRRFPLVADENFREDYHHGREG